MIITTQSLQQHQHQHAKTSASTSRIFKRHAYVGTLIIILASLTPTSRIYAFSFSSSQICVRNNNNNNRSMRDGNSNTSKCTGTLLRARYGAGPSNRDERQRERLQNDDDGALSDRRRALLSLDPEADAQYIQEVLRKDDEAYESEQRLAREAEEQKLHGVKDMKDLDVEALARTSEDAEKAVMAGAKSLGIDLKVLAPKEELDDDGFPIILPTARKESRGPYQVVTASRQGTYVGSAAGWNLEVFPGDFVVHRKYGIGRFEGIVLKDKKLNKDGRSKESMIKQQLINKARAKGASEGQVKQLLEKMKTKHFVERQKVTVLELKFSDALLHVPVDKAYRLSRYRGGEALIKPKLSKMKGDTWRKQTEKVLQSTREMAEEVLALYATRETLSRPPFNPELETNVTEFGKSFQYEATPDQKACFEAIENDMVWRRRPMDRLVCGDVGFGKTEVALRAIYRCVANGKQVAFLAPTSVLAAQHMKTSEKRMGESSPFNIKCGLLRGGLGPSTKAGREIRGRIKNGDLELVIGTHALLSKGVQFKDLGLLVIDEEQRFGVKQKERLKLISQGVDVLTLSATPIPRTLQMSISGIRDTSTIRTPPPMRKSTISIVEPFTMDLVREAVQREMDRGGQLFYVVPRVSMVDQAETMFTYEFPELIVAKAHGQMAKGMCEAAVEGFAMGEADILIATTVIENGVDIPNTNTIIIQQAQAFGMSTLYQLRGRVGRSNVQGYAYLLHAEEQQVTEQAEARLRALKDLTALGSGFDVASRDLEIRGAGSLLGTEQSGMAGRIGFDLYMRMLKKAILQLKALGLPNVPRTNVIFPYNEGSIEGKQAIRIPESFMPDENERGQQESLVRLAENSASIIKLTNEWKSRYGNLPNSLKGKLKSLHLHACTRLLGIDLIGLDGDDCLLRCPGLRPRIWSSLVIALPKRVPPQGMTAKFPPRFSRSNIDDDFEISLEELTNYDSRSDDEDEDWDEYDDEEVEAMKDITSSANVKTLDEANIYDYPRFIIRDLTAVPRGQKIDVLLKALLPLAKVVQANQEADKERARIAVEVRDKREAMKKARKGTKTKQGYFY